MVRTQTKGAPPAPVERGLRSGTKGSINLRIEAQTRQLIDDAAAVLGKTRTEFMIDSARAQAIDVLLDQRLFVLAPERYDAFMHARQPAGARTEAARPSAADAPVAELSSSTPTPTKLSAPIPLSADHDLSASTAEWRY